MSAPPIGFYLKLKQKICNTLLQLTANMSINLAQPNFCIEFLAPEKKTKYRRYQNEKRVKREPGVKRLQTPLCVTTKWEPEIANNKANKIGRKRDRDNKYGKWDDARTDCMYEDRVNAEIRERKPEKFTSPLKRKELRADGWNDYNRELFPRYTAPYTSSCAVWDSYGEIQEAEETARAIRAISGVIRSQRIHNTEPTADDSYEYILIGNELREDFDAEDDWVPR